MTTRIGKIGRLPKSTREELGRRIEDGLPGNEIVQWLNTQPDVVAVLAKYFEGRAVNEQNLCDWKVSGHVDWVRGQEANVWAGRMMDRAGETHEATEGRLGDALAAMLLVEMGRLGEELLEAEADPERRWSRLQEINRELAVLRRQDLRCRQIEAQKSRDDFEVEYRWLEHQRQQKEEEKQRMLGMLEGPAERLRNEEDYGKERAEMRWRVKYDQPMEDILDGTWRAKLAAEEAAKARAEAEAERREKSRRVKVRKEDGVAAGVRAGKKGQGCGEKAKKARGSRPVKADQGGEKSDGRNPKAEGIEQSRPNVGLAKVTKGLQTEKFADRKMGDDGWMAQDEAASLVDDETGNEPGRETGAPSFAKASSSAKATEDRTEDGTGAENSGESSLIKANQGQRTDRDGSNQIHWTKEELEGLAELRRQKQNSANLSVEGGTELTCSPKAAG